MNRSLLRTVVSPLSRMAHSSWSIFLLFGISFLSSAAAKEETEGSPSWMTEEVRAEHVLIESAMKAALSGNTSEALSVIQKGSARTKTTESADAVFMSRVARVAGFLRNQSRNSEAHALATAALRLAQADPQVQRDAKARGDVRYWKVYILAEIIGDFEAARTCALQRSENEDKGEMIHQLLHRLPEHKSKK